MTDSSRQRLTSLTLALTGLAAIPLATIGCGGTSGVEVPSISEPLGAQKYTWNSKRSTSGPVLVYVSLPRQEAMVYRNGIRIGRASVSSGKPGHQTPTGVFQILQKDIDHHSATYDNAPMPYMERLTWDGVAMHTGFNPGHAASHGCIRLPDGFARELYKISHVGGTVIVTNNRKLPTMTLTDGPGASGSGSGDWSRISNSGATSMVVSTSERRAVVYQNGKEVGSAPVELRGKLSRFTGEEAFLYAGDQRWQTVEGGNSFGDLKKNLQVPPAFHDKLHETVHPGTTLVVTSEPLSSRGARSRELLAAGDAG